MRSFPICRNHRQKTIRTGEKIPLYGKGGVNEDMAIVSFVCVLCVAVCNVRNLPQLCAKNNPDSGTGCVIV